MATEPQVCSRVRASSRCPMRLLAPVSLLSLTTLLLAACASEPVAATKPPTNPADTQTSAAAGDDTVCTREYPTGSNIPVTRCKTRAQIEKEQAAAHETMRRAQTLRPNTRMGGGPD